MEEPVAKRVCVAEGDGLDAEVRTRMLQWEEKRVHTEVLNVSLLAIMHS